MSDQQAVTSWVRLGGVVRDARLAAGHTQAALAERASVSRSWLARVEAGHRGAELEPLLRLLAALDLRLMVQTHPGNAGQPVPADPTTADHNASTIEAALRSPLLRRRRAWDALGDPSPGSGGGAVGG